MLYGFLRAEDDLGGYLHHAPNPANAYWLFRAFGEAGVHGLFDSVAMGNPWAAKG